MKRVYALLFGLLLPISLSSDVIENNFFVNVPYTIQGETKIDSKDCISPDNKYTAFTENDGEFIVIVDMNNYEVFRYKFDSLCSHFLYSDAIHVIGWSDNSNCLWFISWTPTNIAYIAKVNILEKKFTVYDSPRLERSIMSFKLDCNTGIFLYTEFYLGHDTEERAYNEKQTYTIHAYDIMNNTKYDQGKITGKEIMNKKNDGHINLTTTST